MNNKLMIQPTPIPIETCLTFNDAVKDNKLFNRYWFDYPAEWLTASNNEKIIGVRSLFLLKAKRILMYTYHMRKYLKSDYKAAYQAVYGKVPDEKSIHYKNPPADDLQNVINKMIADKKNISEITIPIISWFDEDGKLKKIYQDMLSTSQPYIQKYNASAASTMPKFCISADDPRDRDIQMDGRYIESQSDVTEYPYDVMNIDNSNFIQVFYSPRSFIADDTYFVDIKFTLTNNDFNDIMNIGASSDSSTGSGNDETCNKASDLSQYMRCHVFKNIWDRHTCKIFSSLASQSHKNYLCHTDVHFNPIKYYIVKSTDTKFYIDVFAGRHPKVPIKLPKGESFFIELQLEQAKKLLYV